MDLLIQVCRSDRTGINIKSDEDERAVMVIAIFAHILTLHESHVGAERERPSEPRSGAPATDLRVSDDSVKVGNFGWIIDESQRCRNTWQRIMMDENAKRGRAPRNRFRLRGGRSIVRPKRSHQPGRKRRYACCSSKKVTSCHGFIRKCVELVEMLSDPLGDKSLPSLILHRHPPRPRILYV